MALVFKCGGGVRALAPWTAPWAHHAHTMRAHAWSPGRAFVTLSLGPKPRALSPKLKRPAPRRAVPRRAAPRGLARIARAMARAGGGGDFCHSVGGRMRQGKEEL